MRGGRVQGVAGEGLGLLDHQLVVSLAGCLLLLLAGERLGQLGLGLVVAGVSGLGLLDH